MTELTSDYRREHTGFELVSPKDVLTRSDLAHDEKVRLLRQWEQDIREGLAGGRREEGNALAVTLDEVVATLRTLGEQSVASDRVGSQDA